MRRGWEAEARNWAEFARTPGHDVTHDDINLPAVLGLLPEPAGLTLERGGVHLTFHSEHRPLESYGRALEAAGLLIEAIREPKAPDELVAGQPGKRRWQRIPLALQLRAVKP